MLAVGMKIENKHKLNLPSLLLAAATLLITVAAAAERQVYRYVMPDGKIVVTDSPLPEHAIYGYEVIDPDTDKVIRRVEPQQSANEYETERLRRYRLEQCQTELRTVRYRYATVGDIERSRDNNLGAIDHRMNVIRSGLTRAELDLQDNLNRAAESERAGESVDAQVASNIDRLHGQIEALGAELEQKMREREAAVAKFAREIDRFVEGNCDAWREDPG